MSSVLCNIFSPNHVKSFLIVLKRHLVAKHCLPWGLGQLAKFKASSRAFLSLHSLGTLLLWWECVSTSAFGAFFILISYSILLSHTPFHFTLGRWTQE